MNIEFVEREYPNKQTVIGIDEAGRGPLAGPLSLASVSFSRNQLSQIENNQILSGLNDSKKVTARKRDQLFLEITEKTRWSHVFISNKSIDKFGISACIFRGIVRLLRFYSGEDIQLLIDGNYKFEKYFNQKTNFDYTSIIKGDSKVVSIAAASIIAKVLRDRYMKNLSLKFPIYGFDKNMGYGTKLHSQAIIENGLTRYHRSSFIHITEPGLFG